MEMNCELAPLDMVAKNHPAMALYRILNHSNGLELLGLLRMLTNAGVLKSPYDPNMLEDQMWEFPNGEVLFCGWDLFKSRIF